MITDKPRPYWHVDAKWICGLLGMVAISALLLLVGLYRLTDAQRAPAFVTELVGSVFTNPNEPEVDKLELKKQLQPLYTEGVAGVAKHTAKSPDEQAKMAKQLQPLNAFTKQGHDRIVDWLAAAAVAVALLLASLVYFSAGAGRLVSPAVVIMLSALPGALVFLTLASGQGRQGPSLGSLGPSVLHLVGQSFVAGYLAALVLAVSLLIAATIVKIRRR